MFELVRAQCPACGAKLKVDSRKDVAQCEYCGQRSALRTRGTPPATPPPSVSAPISAPGATPTPMPVIELPNPSRRIALALILPVVLMLFISGLVYFIISTVNETIRGALGGKGPSGSFISFGGGGDDDDDELPSLPAQGSFLESPELVLPRVEQVADPPLIRYLSIKRQNIEVYPADGRRYSIRPAGKPLRRGGAIPVPETAFELEQADLARLPDILATAAEHSGSSPTGAVLSAPDGTPQWSISVWSKAGGGQLRYSTDGTLLDE